MSVDRRTLLRALGALALAGGVPAAARAASAAGAVTAPTLAQFGALSAVLTGYPAPAPEVSARVLKAFATPARRGALAGLAKVVAATPASELDATLKARGLEGLANDLVGAWYSGVVTQPGNRQQLVLYTNAFVWTAMTFSKPMGVCGGPTNYWSQPPQ